MVREGVSAARVQLIAVREFAIALLATPHRLGLAQGCLASWNGASRVLLYRSMPPSIPSYDRPVQLSLTMMNDSGRRLPSHELPAHRSDELTRPMKLSPWVVAAGAAVTAGMFGMLGFGIGRNSSDAPPDAPPSRLALHAPSLGGSGAASLTRQIAITRGYRFRSEQGTWAGRSRDDGRICDSVSFRISR